MPNKLKTSSVANSMELDQYKIPLFRMQPPFPMMHGKQIKVTSPRGSFIGELVCDHREESGQFGIRIDAVGAAIPNLSPGPIQPGVWKKAAEYPIIPHPLTEAQISSIAPCDEEDHSFTLQLN